MDVNFLKWLLEVDIRAKNATSMLVALVTVVVGYFILSPRPWVQAMSPWSQGAALTVLLLISFLAVWLIWTAVHKLCAARAKRRQMEHAEAESRRKIWETLDSLTEWQRKFLLRFVVENRTQIPEWEIGQFQAAWDFEIDVLVRKRIIIRHMSGTYEIHPKFLAYLRENWNRETGELS